MGRAKHFCVAVCLSLSGAASLPAADDSFAQHLRAGTEEVRQSKYSAAMTDLESAVELNPASAEAWYQLGLLYGQIADFKSAESAFRRVVALQPDFAPAHYSLGLTLTANPKSKLDWPGAMAEFRAALKIKPEYAEALNMLGAGLTSTGEIDSAIPELEHAIRVKPAFSAAHFNLAIALEKNDRLAEAAKQYRLAVSTKGEYPEATTALGKLLLRMGRPKEAEQELDCALRQNPDLGDAHYALARDLQSVKRYDEADAEFAEAKDLAEREQDATQSSILSNTGLELAAKGNLKEAAASLRKAIALKPDYGIPHYNLGLILADLGDTFGAAGELAKAISLMPGQSRPWFDLGRVRKLQGDSHGALEAVSWAARLLPSDASIRSELESMRAASPAVASQTPTPLLNGQPRVGSSSDTAPDHVAFAEELSAKGDAMGAVGELLRALTLQPNSLHARRRLAKSYEMEGDRAHAILEYYKIIRAVPRDVAIHLALGKLLLEDAQKKRAMGEFRVAMTLRPNSREAKDGLNRAKRALANQTSPTN